MTAKVIPPSTPPTPPTQTTPSGPPADAPEPSADGSSDQSGGGGNKGKSSKSGPERRGRLINEPSPNRDAPVKRPLRNSKGVPTMDNPSTSLALPGPAPVGVPNFFIKKFSIPPFLLSIYQAAGIQYGVRWEVLAAINEIETDYGRNLNVSSAGAMGWMQFIPSSWKRYGVDANQDGKKDPYNPVDAIFAAARYLKAAGADKDLKKAIFAYNHADWYVDSVLLRARMIGGLPADLVGSLSGLTQGQFPVHAEARYADDLSERDAKRRVARGKNAAVPVEGSNRRGINVFAKPGSPVVAVQDGTITKVA
ncbi:MAG: lytic transglycosylase domain-containing protein, partial [Actinomycetota bacterium]|nr:lytic transglycosylase domain-containing protein [Actinomycetota bacterium]